MDARRILFFALGLSAVSALGFAFLASGVWSATLWRCLQGIGLAGTYMPGLKALTDRIPDRMQSRSVAFYTSSFGIGTSLSFLPAGEVSAALDWHWARSEEHTSELQSLMRISYAVFCLKKKIITS